MKIVPTNYEGNIRIGRLNEYGSLAPYISESEILHPYTRNTRKSKIKKVAKGIGVGLAVIGTVAGAVAVYAVGGALIGAVFGEILDHVPYLGPAIQDTLNTIFHTNYFTGNLDKVGATLGFIGGFFRYVPPKNE
ncbi:MAG: hypothetical protein QXY70_03040 [Nanopusillaceae archaeon]